MKIILVAPSGSFTSAQLEEALVKAKTLGLEIIKSTQERVTVPAFLNGSKNERSEELLAAEGIVADGIWCIRGGCGALELWQNYPRESYQASSIPLIGYSDATVLHFIRFYRAKRIGIHGPIFLDLRHEPHNWIEVLRLLVEKKAEVLSYPSLKSLNHFVFEKIHGELLVMNLASLESLLGLFDISFLRGKILALEEINESPFRIFRSLVHLKNTGALSGLKGMVIGHLGGDRQTVIEEIFLPLANELGIPLFDWPIFGHEKPNWPLLFGAKCTISKIDNHFFTLAYDEQHDHEAIHNG